MKDNVFCVGELSERIRKCEEYWAKNKMIKVIIIIAILVCHKVII